MIRRLAIADAYAFYEMRLRCMAEAYDFFRSSVADIEADGIADCQRRLQSEHVRIVGVFDNDALIGIGGFTVYGREPQSVQQGEDNYIDELLMWRAVT